MTEFAKEILPVNLEDEMQQSYLDYAMSVIVGRALPDVRDGLKPVHRRVLFAMGELGNDWNKPYKKSARVVGDVIGKYHPHGDMAIVDALIVLANKDLFIEKQGNFGNILGRRYGKDGKPLGAALADIRQIEGEIGLPDGVTSAFTGAGDLMGESFAAIGFSMLLAVILIYMVLAAQFESLVQPLVPGRLGIARLHSRQR